MALLDDILNPGETMLGPQGVKGTVAVSSQPQPKKKVQPAPSAPQGAKPPAPVDLSDNPFRQSAPATPSGNPFAGDAEKAGQADAMVQQLHKDYASGELQRRTAILNRNDIGGAQDVANADTYADRLGSMAERAASVIPGGSAVMTGERMALTGEPRSVAARQDAMDAIEAAQNAPGVTIPQGVPLMGGSRISLADLPTAMASGRALFRTAPGSGAVGGSALYGGALRASNPIPESLPSRAGGTALAALEAAALPAAAKLGGEIKAGVQASSAPSLDENLVARGGAPGVSGGARGEAAGPLYDQFRAQPDLPLTPALESHFNLPIVRRALRTVQGESSALNGLSPTNPAVLDAVYKRIGNKAWTSAQGYEAGETANTFKDAIDQAADQAGQPLYSPAVDTFAEHSGQMDAVERGSRAMQYAASPKGVPIGAIADSPAAFKEWVSSPERTPAELQAAKEGIQARLQVEPKTTKLGIGPVRLPIPTGTSRALQAAPELLNLTQDPSMLSRTLDAALRDEPPGLKQAADFIRSRFSPSADVPPPTSRPPSATATALPTGQYDLGTGSPRMLSALRQVLQLEGGRAGVPTEGAGPQGPAIPMRGVAPTDAEMFRDLIPPSRQLQRGPLVTPRPLPASAEELARSLMDPEVRRRLGLP